MSMQSVQDFTPSFKDRFLDRERRALLRDIREMVLAYCPQCEVCAEYLMYHSRASCQTRYNPNRGRPVKPSESSGVISKLPTLSKKTLLLIKRECEEDTEALIAFMAANITAPDQLLREKITFKADGSYPSTAVLHAVRYAHPYCMDDKDLSSFTGEVGEQIKALVSIASASRKFFSKYRMSKIWDGASGSEGLKMLNVELLDIRLTMLVMENPKLASGIIDYIEEHEQCTRELSVERLREYLEAPTALREGAL